MISNAVSKLCERYLAHEIDLPDLQEAVIEMSLDPTWDVETQEQEMRLLLALSLLCLRYESDETITDDMMRIAISYTYKDMYASKVLN